MQLNTLTHQKNSKQIEGHLISYLRLLRIKSFYPTISIKMPNSFSQTSTISLSFASDYPLEPLESYLQCSLQIKVNYQSTMIEEQQVFYSHEDPEWINKNRTLVVSSRGMTAQQRSFMLALFALMPHAKKDCKLQKHDVREQIAELCETFKTRYFMYFEVKRKVRYSLWVGKYPEGPSIKLDLENIVSLKDIRFQGNSVKGARHILSFDGGFETGKLALLKEVLIGMLNVPKHHPKSTGVVDHVLNFANEKDSISFRNYQIFRETVNKDKDKLDLFEIGPRFIMNINCILDGVMGGEVLYRAPVTKLIPKKSKLDKRTLINPTQVKPKNVFGEEQ